MDARRSCAVEHIGHLLTVGNIAGCDYRNIPSRSPMGDALSLLVNIRVDFSANRNLILPGRGKGGSKES